MANYLTTDTDLTSVANAIRTKGGTSAQLEFPADFVSAIAAIPTGGGGYNFSWPSSVAEVTIEANSVTNAADADSYFSSYGSRRIVILEGTPSTNNQMVAFWKIGSSTGYRYRNGSYSNASLTTSYDAKLVVGTKYLVLSR